MIDKPFNIGSNGNGQNIKYDEKFLAGKGSTWNDNFWCNAKYGVDIGCNTLIGPNCVIQTSNHVIKNINIEQNACDNNSWCNGDRSKRTTGKSVCIGDDVWIGANVIILPGSKIPDKCIIGAGCIITESNSSKLECGDIVVLDTKLKKIGSRKDYE